MSKESVECKGCGQTLDSLIMSLIGGLNGRRPFFEYLKRRAKEIIDAGGTRDDVVHLIKSEHNFWSALLKNELKKYDTMRDEEAGAGRTYAFVHFEFDDLFRYYENPVQNFKIDIHERLSEERQAGFVDGFRKAIEDKRQIPWTFLPVSFPRFIWLIYRSLFVHLLKFMCYIAWGKEPLTREETKALTFWKASLLCGIGLNIFTALFLYQAAVSARLQGMSIIFLLLLQCFLIPISLRAFIQLLRTIIAFRYSRRNLVAPIKTWRHVRRYFDQVREKADPYQVESFHLMLQEMRANNLITGLELKRFSTGDVLRMPLNETARYRVRRWMNKFYYMKIADTAGPVAWNELESLSILVFSLDEKFFYAFDELIDNSRGGTSILEQLRTSYDDEWENLIDGLHSDLYGKQENVLRTGDFQEGFFSGPVISAIERWANMRIQCLYHTLESMKGLKGVYERIARRQFPEATGEHIQTLVREKIQIMFLHDRYPAYGHDDRQKKDIDSYLSRNSDVELYWPKDLLYPSKYGSFANILPDIRGEFLLKLDADHHADVEEVAYIPYLFRIFKRQPLCDAVGFRLYAFNEKYNFVTHMAGLSNNAWWVHDLRVKSLVGGGGVYGKMLIRTRALLEKEFIQPDSVAEDMLAMTRLSVGKSEIQFSELVEIGQGEDISYYGLKRKLGRYPIGAVESIATKLYKEMLVSTAVPLHRKLESIFMLSYYPIQSIIVLAHFSVLLAWALGIDIFSFLPITVFLLSYFAVALVDGLYVWVHMHEREGIIRGTKRYFATLLPMVLFHGGYFYYYLEQLIKGLKGYAKFNISEKKYQLSQDRWDEHYQKNKFAFNLGSVSLGLFIWGLMFQRHSLSDTVKVMPFVFSNLVWGFSMLFFVYRAKKILRRIDFFGEVIFIFLRSCYDILTSPVKIFHKKSKKVILTNRHLPCRFDTNSTRI